MSLLSARGVSKAYGARVLFDAVDLTLDAADRVGLLGINGAGKSSLLRVLAGVEAPDAGAVERRRSVRIEYLAQEPVLDGAKTPREIVEEGLAEWRAVREKLENATRALETHGPNAERLRVQAELTESLERLGGWDRGHEVADALERLGASGIDRPVASLSGGERRRIAIARVLVARPDLAILDEPTNHLDTSTIEYLEELFAERFAGALLLVTHDRYVLDAVATRIVELDHGHLTEFRGNYSDYLEQKAEMLAHAERAEANRLNFLRRERAWLARGAKARSTKQKARIQRAQAAIAVDAPEERESARIEGAPAARLGGTVLELREVTLAQGGRRLIEPLTLHLVAGDRVGIVGANGVGKTSLLRAAIGELAPESGAVVRGARTRVAYFDQARADLKDDWSVFDNVADREGAERDGGGVVDLEGRRVDLRTYLEGLLLDAHQQRQRVSALSGGERARVALAKILRAGANLLLLDEPTNDLDVTTLGALEQMLLEWSGCVMVVSHDRAFLDRVATSILAFEPGARTREACKVVRYAGGYDAYRAQAEAARAAAASEPLKRAGVERAKSESRRVSGGPKQLTFAERLELDGIFDAIGRVEARVAELEAELADPALYVNRASDVRSVSADLDAARAELARLTARWEDLETRKNART